MSVIASSIKNLFAALAISAAALAPASATVFSISDVILNAGTGYGVDTGGKKPENGNPTLLDVVFTDTFTSSSKELTALGSVWNFTIGTVAFKETDDGEGENSGIRSGEDDLLNVSAQFVFSSPDTQSRTLTADGKVTLGQIVDDATDYLLSFEALEFGFGSNGGKFQLAIAPLSFSALNSLPLTLNTTLTLTALDKPVVEQPVIVDPDGGQTTPGKVPEPGSLALLGLAVAAVGVARRRKQA